MDFVVVINKILSLFLIIIVGIYCYKKKIISESVNDALGKLLLEVTLPCMIITSFILDFNSEIRYSIIKCFIYSPIVIIMTIILSSITLRLIKSKEREVMHFANIFSNCGFIGFPIIGSLFGDEGIMYASIFNMFFTIFLWTYGVIIFSNTRSKDRYKVVFNPSIIAVIIGLLLLIFNITLPDMIDSSLKLIGGLTSPISMLVVGVTLAKVNIIKYLKDYKIYYSSFLKLIFLPIVLIILFRLCNDKTIVAKIMILITAMPAAVTTTIFAKRYGGEEEYSAVVVFSTTLMSLLTLPLIIRMIL